MMDSPATVLFVDDEPSAHSAFGRSLLDWDVNWNVMFASSGGEAIGLLRCHQVDVVITDLWMPGQDGFALLENIRQTPSTRDIPVVMITGRDNDELKHRAVSLGATDLLEKPIHSKELFARIRACLDTAERCRWIAEQRRLLEELLGERTQQVEALKLEVIWRLAKLIEYRDEYTGNHVIRVGCYAERLAKMLGESSDTASLLLQAAPLHDLGKIGIPDALLLKPGPLTSAEQFIMRQHCQLGADMLRQNSKLRLISARLTGKSELMSVNLPHPGIECAAVICMTHHERWDGTGYPAGLRGEAIPIAGRITAVCDVYDALRSRRPYKNPMSEEETLSIIRRGAGTHFDSRIVRAFERITGEFSEIWNELGDEQALPAHCTEVQDAFTLC